jgi:hypothetical protein
MTMGVGAEGAMDGRGQPLESLTLSFGEIP